MELEHIVEALIFASPDGVSAREIARVIQTAAAAGRRAREETPPEEGQGAEVQQQEEEPAPPDANVAMLVEHAGVSEDQVTAAIVNLQRGYETDQRAFTLVERPTGWRIAARPEYAPWVRQLFPEKKAPRLSPSALETLAIVAYRQPVTKASIEAVRGVSVDGPLQTLLDRNIIRIGGRAELPGRPLLYETTDRFLEHFGIRNVDDLPNAAELRAVKLPEPEEEAAQAELPLEGAPKSRKGKSGKAAGDGSAQAEAASEIPEPSPETAA